MGHYTWLKMLEKGKPESREKAHACREVAATKPNVEKMYMAMRRDVMTVVPAFDCVAV